MKPTSVNPKCAGTPSPAHFLYIVPKTPLLHRISLFKRPKRFIKVQKRYIMKQIPSVSGIDANSVHPDVRARADLFFRNECVLLRFKQSSIYEPKERTIDRHTLFDFCFASDFGRGIYTVAFCPWRGVFICPAVIDPKRSSFA